MSLSEQDKGFLSCFVWPPQTLHQSFRRIKMDVDVFTVLWGAHLKFKMISLQDAVIKLAWFLYSWDQGVWHFEERNDEIWVNI